MKTPLQYMDEVIAKLEEELRILKACRPLIATAMGPKFHTVNGLSGGIERIANGKYRWRGVIKGQQVRGYRWPTEAEAILDGKRAMAGVKRPKPVKQPSICSKCHQPGHYARSRKYHPKED